MTLSADPLLTIHDLLYDQWNTTPSKTTIGETGFIVVPRKQKMTGRAITVAEETEGSRSIAGGTASPVLCRYTVLCGAWTQDKAERYAMTKEIKRIIEANKNAPGGGIHHLELLGSRPRNDLGERSPIMANEVRVSVVYWQ